MSIDTTSTEEASTETSAASTYRCSFCEAEYSEEVFTRVHITRSDDKPHKNYNGFMPETFVERVGDDGTTLETIEWTQTTSKPDSLDLSSFPDEYDQRQRLVLKIGAYKAEAGYREIHERANNVLEVRDFEPVSYETVRRWLREFYMPQLEGETDPDSNTTKEATEQETEQLSDLTPKQQAVVITYLDDPDASNTELAERSGCSSGYPPMVLERAHDLITRLSDRLNTDESLEALLTEELSTEDRERLAEDDLLGSTVVPTETTSEESHTSDVEDEAVTDGPVNTPAARIMSAAPEDIDTDQKPSCTNATSASEPTEIADNSSETTADVTDTSQNGDGSLAESASNGNGDSPVEESSDEYTNTSSDGPASMSDPTVGPSRPDAAEAGESEMVPKSELQALRDRVQFVRRIAEQELTNEVCPENSRARTQLALARELETEIETLLES